MENEMPIRNETFKIALQGEIYPLISSRTSNIITQEEIKRINENDQFNKNGLEQIHRIQYSTSQMLSWDFDKISLEKLKKVKISVRRYFTKLLEIIKRLEKYSTIELENCAIVSEEVDKTRLPTVELWDIVNEEIWKRRCTSLQLALTRIYGKKLTAIYISFEQKNVHLCKKLRNGHQQFIHFVNRNLNKFANLQKTTVNLIREKILQIDSDKNMCKNFRENKEIISKAVFEASKIYHSHFFLINKSFGKYIKPRKFFPIFKVNVNRTYHKISISKITALNENKIVNDKKWTSRICKFDQFVKNIVTSSYMKSNWKYRKKLTLSMEETLVKI